MSSHSLKKIIRVKKADSALVYFILESYEGITSFSTLPFATGDNYRDLELNIPPDFIGEVEELIKDLGDLVYEIHPQY